MSSWAYACRPCRGDGDWWVACPQVDEMPAAVRLLRVQVDGDWLCAHVDRSRRVAVDGSLLREAVASNEHDCPECAERVARAEPAVSATASAASATSGSGDTGDSSAAGSEADGPGVEVQAAAISLADRRFVVVLVPLDVVRSPGEADMLAADLRQRLGGADLVLMGQADDGTPEYHGDAVLLALLAGVPVDRMPWKSYHLR